MIIGSNNLFRSSIYNSACRIYSYMWCGLVEIICYRMLASLDFYYVILHVTVIYLFYNRLTSWTVQSKDKCNLMRVFFNDELYVNIQKHYEVKDFFFISRISNILLE